MHIRRHEDHFHSGEQVQGYIAEAERIVTELELEGRFAEIAFEQAIQLLQGKNITYEQLQGVPSMALPDNRGH